MKLLTNPNDWPVDPRSYAKVKRAERINTIKPPKPYKRTAKPKT